MAFGGRQLKKVSFEHLKSRDFDPNSWAPPMIFHLTSIWSSAAASKLEAVKSSLLNKSFSDQKFLADLLFQLLKFQ